MDQKLNAFITQYNGQQVPDPWGGYAGECVSLAKRWGQVLGAPADALYCSKTGGARDLFEQYDRKIPTYFDRITNNPADYSQLPQPGDIIVWGSSMGSYGHVAIVKTAKPFTVFEQLGTPVFSGTHVKTYSTYNGVLGWLRIKQGGDELITNNDANRLRVIESEVKGWNFDEVHTGVYDAREVAAWSGQSWTKYIDQAWQEGEWFHNLRNKALSFYQNDKPKLEQQVSELTAAVGIKDGVIDRQTKEIESLKAQVGDNTKWETFKALIRELFNVTKG